MSSAVIQTRTLVGRANILMFVAVALFIAVAGLVAQQLFAAMGAARLLTARSYAVVLTIQDLDLAVRSAETGQRGYLLTGDASYLAPYQSALRQIATLERNLTALAGGDLEAQSQLQALYPVIGQKLNELARTIDLRASAAPGPALSIVRSGVGHVEIKQIESILAVLRLHETSLLAARLAAMDQRAVLLRRVSEIGVALLVLSLAGAAWLLNLAWLRAARLEGEQRSLFARLRSSIDSISQGIAVFDRSRTLSDWNHCFQELLDLPDQLLDPGTPYQAIADHLRHDDLPLLETAEQIDSGITAPDQVVSYERSTRHHHLLEVRRTLVQDGGFVLTISDMTKRAEAEAVLRESQKMQAIGQLTGGLAHDFNNLLTVVMGNLEYTRAKLPPEQSALGTRLERAMWAAQRGATLTHHLLAFARRQPLAPAPINLAASMPDLIPLLRRTLGEHIEVRFVETAGLWAAMADPAQLEAAVLNLALNARDAMPDGGRLTIELANKVLDTAYASSHAEVTPGDYTMVAVSDTGTGMTAEILARVFEPFFTTKPDGQGTGLGLPMVFGFVKQSGGHIKIYSEPGEGTTVRLYLPRAIAPVIGMRMDDPAAILPRGDATVLLVEDEAAVREIASEILRELGYRVLEAANSDQALRVFGAEAPNIDLLLTDVVLPGKMRGRELAAYIAKARPGIPVLFMSGYTENAIVHHGRLDDGVHLISKPFKRDQLAQKIAAVLGERRSADVIELRGRSEG